MEFSAMAFFSPVSVICKAFLPLIMSALLLCSCGRGPVYEYPTHIRGADIAATAKSQLGKPYRRGGISPRQGFDCSGLVYWACAQHGIAVPRTSKEQADVGHKVTRSALRPGDIVVFKSLWSGYHSGIYLGQGRFIHSPRPKTRVRIESLDLDYWKKRFVEGRRVARP